MVLEQWVVPGFGVVCVTVVSVSLLHPSPSGPQTQGSYYIACFLSSFSFMSWFWGSTLQNLPHIPTHVRKLACSFPSFFLPSLAFSSSLPLSFSSLSPSPPHPPSLSSFLPSLCAGVPVWMGRYYSNYISLLWPLNSMPTRPVASLPIINFKHQFLFEETRPSNSKA